MAVILDALRPLLLTKQKDGKSLQNYTKRFKIARAALESLIGGSIVITKILTTIQGYTKFLTCEIDIEKTKSTKFFFEQLLVYICFMNANQSRYGLIVASLIKKMLVIIFGLQNIVTIDSSSKRI